jgi:hypothetical protein
MTEMVYLVMTITCFFILGVLCVFAFTLMDMEEELESSDKPEN